MTSTKLTPPNGKRRDPQATRAAILEAAEMLFVDRGFAATSMNEIARSAGVTKSLIHHHFGSKQELWAELKRQLLAHYAEVQMSLMASSDERSHLVERSLQTLFGFLRDNPRFVRLSAWMDLEQDRALSEMAYPDLVSSGMERVRQEQLAGRIRSDIEPAHFVAAMVSLCTHWFSARPEISTYYEGAIEGWDSSYQEAIIKIFRSGVMLEDPPESQAKKAITLRVLEAEFAICRCDPCTPVVAPEGPELWSLSRTRDETSLVCAIDVVPEGFEVEAGWRAFRVQGTLALSLVGILAGLTEPLAAAEVSVFAVSTFDTDYLLVRSSELERAVAALRAAGYTVMQA